MHIIHSDFKKGAVKLKITDPVDLWCLSHLIDPGDLVRGNTTRKVKIGDSESMNIGDFEKRIQNRLRGLLISPNLFVNRGYSKSSIKDKKDKW